METTKQIRTDKRHGNRNNHVMRAKRLLDEAMLELGAFPELRDRVGVVREELLQAFVEIERKAPETGVKP